MEPQRVEEIFQTHAFLRELKIAGRSIETTAEHPFWVKSKGWTACMELAKGDLVASEGGQWLEVDEIGDSGEYTPVYNEERLHRAIGSVTPADKLAGREKAIFEARDQKLEAARERRQKAREAMRSAV